MKKLSFLALAAVGLLFGACTDKDVAESGENQGASYVNGYISVGINLPTVPQSISRATNDNGYPNDNFDLDDGLPAEYAVSSAYLLVFSPESTEDGATFKTAFILDTNWKKNTDPQVTTSTRENVVRKVGSKVAKNDLALVVLNPNSIISFSPKSGEGVVAGEQTVSVNGTELATSTTFKKYKEMLASSDNLDATEMHTNNFYMTNTPLYAAQGSTQTKPSTSVSPAFRTLVPIEHVYETEQAAKDGEASEIFVERGMAKVTLNATPSNSTLGTQVTTGEDSNGAATKSDITFTISGWTLDQTNSKSYLVRSTEGYSDFINLVNGASKIYRFTGNTAIQNQNHPGDYKYRGYFAKDPNYDYPVTSTGTGKYGLNYYKQMTSASFTAPSSGAFAPKYCFENTFDVAHQLRENTTLAQVEVTVGSADLYTIGGITSSIYNADGLQVAIKNVVLEYCKLNGLMNTSKDLTSVKSTDLFNDVTIAAKTDPTYEYEVTAVSIKSDKTDYFISGLSFDPDKISGINSLLGVITKYEDGKSYYAIRIRHFGQDLTPWHIGKKVEGKSEFDSTVSWIWAGDGNTEKEAIDPTPGNVYPDNNANDYLGRYGVLRNNWYDLQIGSIKTLGSPVPLDYSNDTTPDDELDGYINVKINIMAWAKRTQQWSF